MIGDTSVRVRISPIFDNVNEICDIFRPSSFKVVLVRLSKKVVRLSKKEEASRCRQHSLW